MAVRPHRVLDQGRVVHFEDGPLSYQDLRDTWIHVRHAHRARPVEFWVNEEQRRGLMQHTEFAFRPFHDFVRTDPAHVANLLGARIMIGEPPRPERPEGYFHPTEYVTQDPVALWRTGITGTNPIPTVTPEGWRVQFGTAALTGTRIEGMWHDEWKPKVKSTHEVW